MLGIYHSITLSVYQVKVSLILTLKNLLSFNIDSILFPFHSISISIPDIPRVYPVHHRSYNVYKYRTHALGNGLHSLLAEHCIRFVPPSRGTQAAFSKLLTVGSENVWFWYSKIYFHLIQAGILNLAVLRTDKTFSDPYWILHIYHNQFTVFTSNIRFQTNCTSCFKWLKAFIIITTCSYDKQSSNLIPAIKSINTASSTSIENVHKEYVIQEVVLEDTS